MISETSNRDWYCYYETATGTPYTVSTATWTSITFSFPYASSTNHSVRLVRVNDLGTVTPFGGDATADKYTAVVNNFCTATSSTGTNHDIVYATPINIGTTENNFSVYYQFQ